MYEIACRVSLQFWANARDIIVYLINRGPSSALDGGILEEAWTGKHAKILISENFWL